MDIVYSRLRAAIRPILLGSWFMFGSVAMADSSAIDNIKSVYIYNFLSFIQWPKDQSSSDEYRLCALANQALIDTLKAVVQNEQVDGRSLVIVPYRHVSDAENCHLIYLEQSALKEAESFIGFGQPGTLLIGDAEGFVSEGMGMVGFEIRGRKVRVAMNLTRLQEAGFKVSSKLLRVVRIER